MFASSEKQAISTESILTSINTASIKLRDPKAYQAVVDVIKAQKTLEDQLLLEHTSCPANVSKELVAENVDSLDFAKLKSDVGSQFYNGDALNAVMCIASSLALDKTGDVEMVTRIRSLISDLRLFGAESVSGFALRGSLGTRKNKAKDLFVIKAPRNPADASELTHELIVAFYGTNKLRSIGIPNFAYVYGGMFCSPPFMDSSNPKDKEILSFCNSGTKDPVMYAIYENIASAQSFEDFSRKPKECTGEMFMCHFVATCAAINAANMVCDFTHYDAHSGNVLIRNQTGVPISYPIPTPEGEMIISSFDGGIPTIIDYGMSHIALNIDGVVKHFGHVGATAPLDQYGVSRTESNTIYDAYKLLCFSLSKMCEFALDSSTGEWTITAINNPAFNELSGLLSFFTSEAPVSVISRQLSSWYALAIPKESVGLDMWQFIKFCQTYCSQRGWRCSLSPVAAVGVPVLRCDANCVSTYSELQAVGALKENPIPTTFNGFKDVYSFIYSRYKANMKNPSIANPIIAEIESLRKGFVSTGFDAALRNEYEIYQTCEANFKPFVPVNPPSRRVALLDPGVLKSMKSFVGSCARYFDALQRLKTSSGSMKTVAKLCVSLFDKAVMPTSFLNLQRDVDTLIASNEKFTASLKYTIASLVMMVAPSAEEITSFDAVARADYEHFIDSTSAYHASGFPEDAPYRWYVTAMPPVAALIV